MKSSPGVLNLATVWESVSTYMSAFAIFLSPDLLNILPDLCFDPISAVPVLVTEFTFLDIELFMNLLTTIFWSYLSTGG